MRTRQLSDLISDVRQRTNQENSTFVTDAEITEYLNVELAELWTRLVLNEGQPHYRAQYSIPTIPGQALYSLPADFWRVQEVTATLNGATVALCPFMAAEHGSLQTESPWGPGTPLMYRIQAGNIEILPATRALTVTLYYSPTCPRLVNGTDVFDGFNGYEVAAIYGACATVLAKEESDPGFYLSLKERIYKHIDALAGHRDASAPERVQDVQAAHLFAPLGWWR